MARYPGLDRVAEAQRAARRLAAAMFKLGWHGNADRDGFKRVTTAMTVEHADELSELLEAEAARRG